MKKLHYVICMETSTTYGFLADTAYEALDKMKYTLGVAGKCDSTINKTESGMHLWMEHNGMTYAVRNA